MLHFEHKFPKLVKLTCCAWLVFYKTATVLKGQDYDGGQGGNLFLKNWSHLQIFLHSTNGSRNKGMGEMKLNQNDYG